MRTFLLAIMLFFSYFNSAFSKCDGPKTVEGQLFGIENSTLAPSPTKTWHCGCPNTPNIPGACVLGVYSDCHWIHDTLNCVGQCSYSVDLDCDNSVDYYVNSDCERTYY